MKKYLWFFIFLVSWKVQTCNTYFGDISKMHTDEYGVVHIDSRGGCDIETVEKRKFFKTERGVVNFIKNAPGETSDFKIQEFGDKK